MTATRIDLGLPLLPESLILREEFGRRIYIRHIFRGKIEEELYLI